MNELDEYCGQVASRFGESSDLSVRRFGNPGGRFALVFLKTVCSRDYISETVLKPLRSVSAPDFDGDFETVIGAASLTPAKDPEDSARAVAGGECLLMAESRYGFFVTLVNAQTGPGRSVTEPTSDVTVRGPKAGFIEDVETNLALLRKYVRSDKLRSKQFVIGTVSRTRVLLVWVDGRASARLVAELKSRLDAIRASVVTDSFNLSMLLEGRRDPLFPSCGTTEKVDKAASKLMAGRVAMIVDGSPFVLTAPYVFAESLQASDDYLHTRFYATFIRCLRLVSFLASVFAPGILCALVSFDHTSMPQELYGLIDKSREGVPVSFFWEILAVLILFEILREVGVRMPRPVGDAVGIVGSIILGNTAVDAGIVSSVGVITVAFAAVCAFITPAYMYVIVLFRLAVLLLAELFGVYGLGLGAVLLIALLCRRESFGVPYLFPFAPHESAGLQDFVFAWPKRTLGRRERLGDRR